MGTIAKGEITLNTVNDAYTVSLTKSTFVITANYDGTHPQLDDAYTSIEIKAGIKNISFKYNITNLSDNAIKNDFSSREGEFSTKHFIQISAIPTNKFYGSISLELATEDGKYKTTIVLSYTVIRSSESMLDWVKDWDSNRTEISGDSIITPKVFAGKKNDEGELSGVFIGTSDITGVESAGIYGYNNNAEVFHINGSNAVLGGWRINGNGIYSPSNNLRMLSSGTIAAYTESLNTAWELNENGTANFACGNVRFDQEGNAYFEGVVNANEGVIGSWEIHESRLSTSKIAIDSSDKPGLYLSSSSLANFSLETDLSDFICENGGLYFTVYQNSADFAAYNSEGNIMFEIQSDVTSTCFLAGWSFDNTGIWIGNKNNTLGEYTSDYYSITIGTNGLRGASWRIDANGNASFSNGIAEFGKDYSYISGWKMNESSLSSDYVKISNSANTSGIYIGSGKSKLIDLTDEEASQSIISNGGIYLANQSNECELLAILSNGKRAFRIGSSGTNTIAGWNFDNEAIYTISKCISPEQFPKDGSITISPQAIRNKNWSLYSDGSGIIAGGNIKWNKDGNVTFSDTVKMSWEDGINIAQMIAFGQMLYRDPEFTLDKKNGTELYQDNTFDYCTFDASLLQTAIMDIGLVLRGKGTVIYVDMIYSDGTINEIWTGSVELNEDTPVNIIHGPIINPFNYESDVYTIRIKVKGEDSYIQAEDYDDESNSLGWKNLIGNDSIGEQSIATKREIIDDSEAPNSTQKVVQFTNTRWITPKDARLGGFCFANESRANAKFVVKIVAKIPVNWCIENYNSQYGNNGTTKWVGSNTGTGKYEEYICIVNCGSSGTFNNVNNFAIKPKDGWFIGSETTEWTKGISVNDIIQSTSFVFNSVVWSIAYATIFDATSSDKITTTIDKNGIYTGTLRADQVNALSCTFDKGSIGGWNIGKDCISKDNVSLGADGSIVNGNAWCLKNDGSGYLANESISWSADGSGQICGFKISKDHIGTSRSSIATSNGSVGEWDPDWANLSIYNDSIKVGGAYGYVSFGNDVTPSTATQISITGIVVNHNICDNPVPNVNYGLFIDVSNAKRNYGIQSNAALKAPSFINTKACIFTLNTGNSVMDFSQYNIFLMYSDVETNLTLSTESSVASSFGYSNSLPTDFATTITFKIRQNSKNITIKNIYDHNENQIDYKMAPGDSIIVIITAIDGFKYQIINHSS